LLKGFHACLIQAADSVGVAALLKLRADVPQIRRTKRSSDAWYAL
jgi:hypothetical protein